jgi:hypothetical protein
MPNVGNQRPFFLALLPRRSIGPGAGRARDRPLVHVSPLAPPTLGSKWRYQSRPGPFEITGMGHRGGPATAEIDASHHKFRVAFA